MSASKELTLERTFNSPREKVFEAWTDPEVVARWWAPNGFTNPTCEWDLRPGGNIYIVMLAGPELGEMAGMEAPMTGTFQEVVKPEKIVYTANAIIDGKPALESETTVTFEETPEGTKLTVHIIVTKMTPEAEFALAGMEQGWNEQLDKLVAHLT